MTEPEQVLVNVADLQWAVDQVRQTSPRLTVEPEWQRLIAAIPEPEWEPTDDLLLRLGQAHASVEDFKASVTYLTELAHALHREGLL